LAGGVGLTITIVALASSVAWRAGQQLPSDKARDARGDPNCSRPAHLRRRDTARRPLLLSAHALLLSILVIALALAVHLGAPQPPHGLVQFFSSSRHWRVATPSIALRNPVLLHEPPFCPVHPPQAVDFKGTFHTDTERSMSLAEQARRVAAEFDFPAEHVRRAVKEFIREMGTWRARQRAVDMYTDAPQTRASSSRAPS